MTLHGQNALYCRNNAAFGDHYKNLNADRPIPSAVKMKENDSIFWKYKAYIRRYSRGFLGTGASNDSGVVDDGNF